jgi:hypothetical protein
MVTAHATLSAGSAHLSLTVREKPDPGTWRYNLAKGTIHRVQYGRVEGLTSHMDALKYAADVCAAGYPARDHRTRTPRAVRERRRAQAHRSWGKA